MLERICNEKKSVLKEVTTERLNQLDYIFIDERRIKNSYSTSYKNFISDHKSITIRRSSSKTFKKTKKFRSINSMS